MKKSLFGLLILAFLLSACVMPTLNVVNVSAPDINCVFDSDCTITVSDKTDSLILNGMSGSGFLQSRTKPIGEAGTPGAGLYPYEYRIDLRELVGILNIACVSTLSFDFGDVAPLDYDGDGTADHVYVVTAGGLGNVAPSSVEKSGDQVTFNFSPGVCAGASPGNGDSSFFFGLASTFPPVDSTAKVVDNNGNEYTLDIKAPGFGP